MSSVAAFALGYATVALYGATTADGEAAAAQPKGSASQALAPLGTGVVDPAVQPYLNPKLFKAVPVGPGKVSEPVQKVLTSPELTTVLDASGIPEVALEAYKRAASHLAVSDPACHLPWQLLAAIGRVESDNGQFGGAMLLPNGNTTVPIYGIPLDGRAGVALIRDTVDSKIDGEPNFARAVGPMQFLPSTWAIYGADGNGDGIKDINNIFDAALAAADYLCAGGGNMTNTAQETAAVLRYNDAYDYVRVVLALEASYEHGDFAAVPTAGPTGTPDNGGGSHPQSTSSPHAKAPAPTKTPTHRSTRAPAQSPTPKPTATPTSQPTAPPISQPTATPTAQPTAIPTSQPTAAPTPRPTAPSSPPTGASPTVSPTSTPTESPTANPTANPTTTAPATPAPTDTTETGPTPSSQPSQAPVSFTIPPPRPGQTVDIGWAPAMRQVVVKLLAATKAAPTQPVRPTHRGQRPAVASTHAARRRD